MFQAFTRTQFILFFLPTPQDTYLRSLAVQLKASYGRSHKTIRTISKEITNPVRQQRGSITYAVSHTSAGKERERET